MRTILTITLYLIIFNISNTQNITDKAGVEKACMNYLEGFYEGDTSKLILCLQPSLNKFGFRKDKDSGEYTQRNYMTYDMALSYAKNVLDKKRFAKKDDPKKVEILPDPKCEIPTAVKAIPNIII